VLVHTFAKLRDVNSEMYICILQIHVKITSLLGSAKVVVRRAPAKPHVIPTSGLNLLRFTKQTYLITKHIGNMIFFSEWYLFLPFSFPDNLSGFYPTCIFRLGK
jgi:hypothetical protein